jgi:surfactin synthase thioesterase subunit
VRLFCLPYAGGAATIYHRWQSAFPQSIDVCPIEFPGRLSRLKEAPIRQVRPLVESLCAALDGHLDIPFAFFGYSMGALIAYECAREVLRRRRLEPEHIVVAALAAPHVRVSLRTEALLDDDLILKIVNLYGARIQSILADPEIRAIVLGMIRADLGLLDAYEFEPGPMLRAPITVLGGDRDPSVTCESLGEWSKHTRGTFALRIFAGDHFFLHADEPAVIASVISALHVPCIF